MNDNTSQEIIERLIRIETRLDNYEALREKSETAHAKALKNEEDIKEMKVNAKWAWGFIITLGITVVGYMLTHLQ